MNLLQRYTSCLIVILLPLFFCTCNQIEAKKLILRPLNAREVYRILRSIEREDVIPEGRHVSQGIAAFTGFTLGLKKGIGASILYDIITANVTGLLQENSTSSGTSTGTTATTSIVPQEICFKTRNARSLRQKAKNYRRHAADADASNRIELRAEIYEEDDVDEEDEEDDVDEEDEENVDNVAENETVKPTNQNTQSIINNQLENISHNNDKIFINTATSQPAATLDTATPTAATTSPTVATYPTTTQMFEMFNEGTSATTAPLSSVPGYTTDTNTPTAIITPDIPMSSTSTTTCIVVRRR